MEVEVIQTQACKLSRIGNARNDSSKIGLKGGELYQDEDEEEGEEKGSGGGGVGGGSEGGRLRAWYSSRIHRVSRQTGGKDRHSKVLTAKGLRDRRVRLSVSTAIQFYDLQDRLGYDQPSKAVEWLIKAAADAIAELPSLESKFPGTPKQPSDEKRPNASEPGFDAAEMELDADHSYQQQQQQQHLSLTKSACSSTSETSKGSVLSLSRSEIRVKARERAREKTAAKDKEKEKQKDEPHLTPQQSSHNSFTELLTGGANSHSPTAAHQQNHFFLKTTRHLPSTSMDYFNPGSFGQSSSRAHFSTGFPSQTLFGIAPLPHTMPMQQQPFNVPGDHHPELQHFSFIPDQLISDAAAVTGSDYNLNFPISSGLAGYNRGTLQSNSPSPMPHLQRFSADGPNMSFFIGNVTASAAPPAENQFPAGFDGRLQLCYGDGGRHSDLKGKGKS